MQQGIKANGKRTQRSGIPLRLQRTVLEGGRAYAETFILLHTNLARIYPV